MSLIKINDRIHVGDNFSCFYDDKEGWVVIHACKIPCHQRAVGYRGNLSSSHENYLIKENEKHLYLNMVDMDRLMREFTEPIIKKAIEFIKNNIKKNKIFIHCNVGLSRSPALALIFLAKVSGEISDKSYDEAKNDFLKLYPSYQPGRGIDDYLRKQWNVFNF